MSLAFIFSGPSSQTVGMGAELAQAFASAQARQPIWSPISPIVSNTWSGCWAFRASGAV